MEAIMDDHQHAPADFQGGPDACLITATYAQFHTRVLSYPSDVRARLLFNHSSAKKCRTYARHWRARGLLAMAATWDETADEIEHALRHDLDRFRPIVIPDAPNVVAFPARAWIEGSRA